MTSELTGDDLADLHKLADDHQLGWHTVRNLPQPYITDDKGRVVYVDGRLEIHHYLEALHAGLNALMGELGYTSITSRRRERERHLSPVGTTG